MAKNVKITASMSKTVQERQFEPVQFSATIETEVDSESMMAELDHLYDELEETIRVRMKKRGLN